MSLPQRLPFPLLVTAWAQQLDPIVANPILQGVSIAEILLDSGVEKGIPTTLSRMQQGWMLIDNLANANVWRTQPFNDTFLYLQASADTTVSIWMF